MSASAPASRDGNKPYGSAWSLYKDVLGSPTIFACGDAPFRHISRARGVDVCIVPRAYATHYKQQSSYRRQVGIELCKTRPLIAQFVASEPEAFVQASKLALEHCDAVELNLAWNEKRASAGPYGCPQLHEHAEVACDIVAKAREADVPVICRIGAELPVARHEGTGSGGDDDDEEAKVLLDVNKAIYHAQRLEAAGCQLLLMDTPLSTGAEGQEGMSLADARRLCGSVQVPVVVSAAVTSKADVQAVLKETGAAAVMFDRSLRRNPALLQDEALPVCQAAREYLQACRKFPTHIVTARDMVKDLCLLAMLHLEDTINHVSLATSIKMLEDAVETIDNAMKELAEKRGVAIEELPFYYCRSDIDPETLAFSLLDDTRPLEDAHRQMADFNSTTSIKRLEKLSRRRMRRQLFREDNKAKRAKLAEDDGDRAEEADVQDSDGSSASAKPTFNKKRQRDIVQQAMQPESGALQVAVDCSMDGLMSRKEIIKLATQIRRLYGDNMHSEAPFHMHLCGLAASSPILFECRRLNAGFDGYLLSRHEASHRDVFRPEQIVCLSPDAEEPLLDVKADEVYVLGGLVDEHILRNQTLNAASEAGLRARRLPIQELTRRGEKPYIPVLAINQVFLALMEVARSGNWYKALGAAIPPRKGFSLLPEGEVAEIVARMKKAKGGGGVKS